MFVTACAVDALRALVAGQQPHVVRGDQAEVVGSPVEWERLEGRPQTSLRTRRNRQLERVRSERVAGVEQRESIVEVHHAARSADDAQVQRRIPQGESDAVVDIGVG